MSGVPPTPAPAATWSRRGDLARLEAWVEHERSTPLRATDKGVPPSWAGRTIASFHDDPSSLRDQPTPALTLSEPALAHNLAAFSAWADAHGVAHAPHGKTSMAPALWWRQLRAGAWAITLATEAQVQVAVAAGVPRVLVANLVLRPEALRWLAGLEQTEVICWVDSLEAVALMDDALAGPGAGPARRLPVLVELGTVRTGARSVEDALAVARAVAASPHLELVGVGCYEGVAVSGHTPADADVVRAHLVQLRELTERVRPLVDRPQCLVTAGGSTWFDLVAEVLGPSTPQTLVIVRSGSALTHDDGTYAHSTPSARVAGGPSLHPALHVWSRVLAIHPDPVTGEPRRRAILDAGKRDFPHDAGLPVPQLALTPHGLVPLDGGAGAGHAMIGSNDQHATMDLPAGSPLRVGMVVRCGISHPCTAFDKWRLVAVVDDPDSPDPKVIDWVRTWF